MKFGIRSRSYKKSFSAMTTGRLKRSIKRQVIPYYGRKGSGWIKNPKKAAYNALYHRTTVRSPLPYFTPTGNRKAVRKPRATAPTSPIPLLEAIATSSQALTVTSGNFEQLKQDLTALYDSRAMLRRQLAKAEGNYYLTFLFSSKAKRQAKKAVIAKIKDAIARAYIDLTFRGHMKDAGSWDEAGRYFQAVMQSTKVWDLTSRRDTDKYHERTVANESVDRKLIRDRSYRTLEFIHADVDNLYLPNLNGADLYVYPTFVVLFKDYKQFAIHDLKQVNIAMTAINFHEEQGVPSDAPVVGKTYKYANKNGMPDKRYSHNYTIPIVRYGDLRLYSTMGLNERYMFSNFEQFEKFAKSLVQYAKANLQLTVHQ